MEPIVAPATPLGYSAIGILRLSGDNLLEVVKKVFKGKGKIRERFAHYGKFYTYEGKLLDEVILIYYKAPRSYTGEDMVEVCFHGNPLIIKRALETFNKLGVRTARPGEFTLRAFLNGKMDLAQAEAVNELILAKTELSLENALNQLRGSLSKRINSLKERILNLLAYWESEIEFEEEDIPTLTKEESLEILEGVLEEIKELLSSSTFGRYLREGVKVAIVGRPNVGKSSLFNALLGEERAIVSEFEGTTRDYIGETINLRGIPVTFLDTAGIREGREEVERAGIERSLKLLEEADLIIFVLDATSLKEEDLKIWDRVKTKNPLIVVNKIDLGLRIKLDEFKNWDIIKVSAKEGTNLEGLKEAILKRVGFEEVSGKEVYISLRHKNLLEEAMRRLKTLMEDLKGQELGVELRLLRLREALEPLEEITGGVASEELFGKIFSNFCIGK